MSVKSDLFEGAVLEIKQHLKTYLLEEGVENTSGRFICINPDHDDSNPSATIFTDDNGGQHLKCWACNHTSDIFSAAHILENKPISGTGFFTETIPYLATRFKVELPEYIMSDNERDYVLLSRLYHDAAAFISTYEEADMPSNFVEEINKRGWSDISKLKLYGIGFVPSYDSFRNHLKSMGHSIKIIEESGLSDPYLFCQNRLIYTYHDEKGKPVGFIARNLNYNGIRDESTKMYIDGPKYIFNKNPSNGVKLLKKNERFYLFDKARNSNSSTFFIVEGQPDTFSFHYNGYDNFIGLSGVSMSLEHFEVLRRYGIYDIVICFDNDIPGQKAAESLIDMVLKHVSDIRVRFMFLPTRDGEKIDPELMARGGRFEEFFDFPKVNPFDYMLNKIVADYEESDAELICSRVLPTIVVDPSSIRRETMIGTLSAVTGISERALKEEVIRIIENKEKRTQKVKQSIIDKMVAKVENSESPVEVESILAETVESLRQIDKEASAGVLEPKAQLGTFLEIKRYEEGDTLLEYPKVDPNLEVFMKVLDGDLSQKVIFVPSPANVGKTALFINLIHSIVKNNPNIIVGFLSIDDSLKEIIPRLICYDTINRNGIDSFIGNTFTINHFSTPMLYKNSPYFNQLVLERNLSFKEVGGWINEGRLLILDSEDGRSFDFFASSLRNIREKHPGKKIIFFLDNLHLLTSESWSESGFERIKKLSHEVKALAVSSNSTIISTVELRKTQKGQRADNNDLSGSNSLSYDSNAIAMLYSEIDADPFSNKFFKHGSNTRKYPIIECNITKNKIGSFKGILYGKLYASQAYYHFMTEEEYQVVYGDTEAESYAESLR